ncbi:histidine phosphatase family protein [Peptoniphilus sp. MSJ-1]|uniref:Histidine phosphatase family protein n=1 Tax=Peptoniphilus ovalis TaxID=2841503 RepID=A0ABS6FDT4_9FIRM|nr:histidine phosphatase family protein [Peptoniphilus ovalis]MBU5668346.1 histidine phosphatase family protein [Peptoniphilus ovalis]
MRIYFTRHGETEWNKEDIIQGHLDSPLTDKGIEMGKSLREKSKDIKFDKIYSSDLKRALDTAKLIAGDREVITTPLLREINVGDWSGRKITDVKVEDSELYNDYFNHPEKYNRDDGESIFDLMNRVEKFFEEAIYPEEDENILIVAHGVTIVAMFDIIEKIAVKDFWSNRVRRNGEFNIVDYKDGEFKIIKKAPKNSVDSI